MTTKGCINAFRKGLDKEYLKISAVYFVNSEKSDTFAFLNKNSPARMAESVDALVSNTSGAIRAGSIPAPGTRKWPTDTCRPFLYKIFPTFSPHLTIILQKVFRKRPFFSICFGFFTRYDFASSKINFATIFI